MTTSNTGNAKYSDRILRKALGQQAGGPERVRRADTSVRIHQRRSRERHPQWRSNKPAQHRVRRSWRQALGSGCGFSGEERDDSQRAGCLWAHSLVASLSHS